MLPFFDSVVANYRIFLPSVGIGITLFGGFYTFVRGEVVPQYERGAYNLMSMYAVVVALAGGYALLHYGLHTV